MHPQSQVRVIEKAWLKPDGPDRGDCSTVCDIVRGGLEYDNTSKLLVGFELLLACEAGRPNAKLEVTLLGDDVDAVVIVRIKDRFNAPNPSGYADTMVSVLGSCQTIRVLFSRCVYGRWA
jgi:hypothetical protein